MMTTKTLRYFECPSCGHLMEIAIDPPHKITMVCVCFQACHACGEGTTYKLQEETARIQQDIVSIFSEIQSQMSVRQIYYQLVNRGYPKTEVFYRKAQQEILKMRRTGQLPYSLVTDGSRRILKQRSYQTLSAAIDLSIQNFKLDVWASLEYYVEVWMEKEALAGIFWDVTDEYDVPLHVSRGFASESFIYNSAEAIKTHGKKTAVLLFTDYDPSGLHVDSSIRKAFHRFGCNVEFTRCALTAEQVERYGLPSRPTKQSNHSKGFTDQSTELDALNPNDLKAIIRKNLNDFIPEYKLEQVRAEESILRSSQYSLIS
jgi:hypothetical protein